MYADDKITQHHSATTNHVNVFRVTYADEQITQQTNVSIAKKTIFNRRKILHGTIAENKIIAQSNSTTNHVGNLLFIAHFAVVEVIHMRIAKNAIALSENAIKLEDVSVQLPADKILLNANSAGLLDT